VLFVSAHFACNSQDDNAYIAQNTRKLSNRKDYGAMRRMGALKISGVPNYTLTATFPEFFNGLLFRLSL